MTFITVKHGLNQEILVNSNCIIPVVLDYLKQSCGFEGCIGPKEYLDLATESGDVVDLISKGKEYAKKYLEPRNTYLLIKAVQDGEDNPVYVALTDVNEKVKMALSNPKKREGPTSAGMNVSHDQNASLKKQPSKKPQTSSSAAPVVVDSAAKKPVEKKK